ncbi:gluzincin family metallopeptidase [Mucilaginibacter boryungensis]|uniref:Peptidase M4 n=1 Tax=Mucilaginibacter boryungensis TaxID=768480 RepID=A0ABR9XK38_9SPHI|nr:hypothetical protein [Mucilaginibacter boryungensis]MBE9667636.1 hypothetical protein [Mucilaginibacter boryungensis]
MSNSAPYLIRKPDHRKLRGYAFDPSLSLKMDTVVINEIVYKVYWEEGLETGPSGEYLEVVDYDPSTGKFYTGVDLNHPHILASDGLDTSESNPMFHQQMVYAVAMTTIQNFEKALGRRAMWSNRKIDNEKGAYYNQFVEKLRIYPHALREANAYYSPQKKALLFGYFSASPDDVTLQMPGSLVFTCLSHDIVAHETSHALLDGMHSSYTTPANPDMLAFHEAFADIVALFQHFTFPDVLKHQIRKTRGDLESQNLLGELAQEFGKAIGHYGALRDAIGGIDPVTRQWKPQVPDPTAYTSTFEPHDRGSILVAAIFEAFLSIYKNRIADLLRIYTGGTGILPEGQIHPDLVDRLADEAAKTSGHVLRMCIRALDYCPPTDLNFGDYLRALITADVDSIREDTRGYRLAFIDAFRKRGIYPTGIKTLSVESLLYKAENIPTLNSSFDILGVFLREFREAVYYTDNRSKIFEITNAFIAGGDTGNGRIMGLHQRITTKFDGSAEFEKLTGLVFTDGWQALGIKTSKAHGFEAPSFSIDSLKLANRVGPDGKIINQIVLTMIQRSVVRFSFKNPDDWDSVTFAGVDPQPAAPFPEHCFEFRGSCTLIFDLDTLKLKYVISKPLIDLSQMAHGVKALNEDRLKKQFRFMCNEDNFNAFSLYFGDAFQSSPAEPFALIHQSC